MKRKKSFKHSSNQRNSDAMMRLRIALGPAGYGIYFMLVEHLYETGKPIDGERLDILAYEMHCPVDDLRRVITEFNLFVLTTQGYVLPEMIEPEPVAQDASDRFTDPELEILDPKFAALTVDEQFKSFAHDDDAYNEVLHYVGDPKRLEMINRLLKCQHQYARSNFPNREALIRAVKKLK